MRAGIGERGSNGVGGCLDRKVVLAYCRDWTRAMYVERESASKCGSESWCAGSGLYGVLLF
eukprot:scaffold192_cov331-Pavlova_lutheri.AAC.7